MKCYVSALQMLWGPIGAVACVCVLQVFLDPNNEVVCVCFAGAMGSRQ